METETIEVIELTKHEIRENKRVARLEAEAIEKAEIAERRAAAEPKLIGLNELLFPVELIDNPVLTNSEYSKIVVGDIDGEKMALNYCSPRYELIPNADIFPKIEKVLNDNKIKYDVVYTHISNVRFYADYHITDTRYSHKMKGTTDVIEPMLRVQHSYNGATKYRIMFGYFRLVCSNGLIIPVEEMKKYNLIITGKHTESIKNSFSRLDSMLKMFAADAKSIIGEIAVKYEMLGGRMVKNLDDRLTEVLAATKITAVENSKFNTINDISNRINDELKNNPNISPNGKVTDWLVYNGINQYLNDNNRNIVIPEKRIETDGKVLEYMLSNS